MLDLSSLNEKQLEAVKTINGPVMCIAGAGTGKTRALTYRVAYLIEEKNVAPDEIVAVTFTNKAANEMKERIVNLTGKNIEDMWISTFHSFCLRILRNEIVEWNGYKLGFSVIDEEDSNKIIKKSLDKMNIEKNDIISVKKMAKLISDEKNKEVMIYESPLQKEVYHKVKKEYDNELKKDNLMDFDDLILNAILLLNDSEYVFNKYANQFKYIMVDEFQDTNNLQYELIKILSKVHRNVFIIGDQDQSIYSFRGAKIGNIDLFQRDFGDCKVILLEMNYRSAPEILDLANNVISENTNRIKKNLFTTKFENEKPVLTICRSDSSEVDYIFSEILRLTGKGYKYSDITILYRSNFLSRNFESKFKRYKIPYRIVGGVSYFARKEVKDVLSFLKLAINLDDNFALSRIINVPARKISIDTVRQLEVQSIRYQQSMFKAIDYIEPEMVSKQAYQALHNFKAMILEIRGFISNNNNDAKNVIDLILEKTGYLNMLLSDKKEEGKEKIQNVYELKNVIREAMSLYPGSTIIEKLTAMLEETVLKTDLDKLDNDDNKVKLMTYHLAKGLEFPIVFMMATEDGIFPMYIDKSKNDLEEERRICYVGVTRAMEKLYITCAKRRMMFGQVSFNKPSLFIRSVDKNLYNTLVE